MVAETCDPVASVVARDRSDFGGQANPWPTGGQPRDARY